MTRSSVNSLLLTALCLLGFGITAAAYYPGLMTPDSDFQLQQAQLFSFNDWHPPVMSLVWSALLWVHDGPVPMLALFLVGYWASFWVMSRAFAKRSVLAAWLVVLFAFTPMMINFVGTIWKDVFLVIGFLVTCAGVIRAHFLGVRLHKLSASLLIVLVALSVCARHNAIFTGLALTILVLCYTFDLKQQEWRGMFKACLLGTALYICAFGAMHIAVTAITRPKHAHVSSALFLYDLVGISLRTNQWLLPPVADYDLNKLPKCYEDKGWDLIWLKCADLIDDLHATGDWDHLSGRWISAIASHPKAYLLHRASFVATWVRESDTDHLITGTSKKAVEYGFRERPAYLLIKNYIVSAARAPLLKPLFTNMTWFLLNLIMTGLYVVAFVARRRKETFLPLFISLSGMLYTAPLIFGGVAPDFRYVYWGIAAVLICVATSIAIRHPPSGSDL